MGVSVADKKDASSKGDAQKDVRMPLVFQRSVFALFALVIGLALVPKPFAVFVLVAFTLFYIQMSVSLTFDGFQRFSRYRLSQKHPILDKIVSIVSIAACFLGAAPFALFIKAYSLVVSPDEGGDDKGAAFYNRRFMVPVVQGVLLLCAYVAIFMRF